MDDRVAFTRRLKSASRELGLRGRSIRLSVDDVRRKVLSGSRSDAGFAALGAPPSLVDALSTLFLIPHDQTGPIASEFVAGHILTSVSHFLKALEVETLDRLDIRTAIVGSILLETEMRRLLHEGGGVPLNTTQPFAPQIALIGTATDHSTHWPFLLGVADAESYDFVAAMLASSAFPAVFEPRRESEIFPGLGRPDVLFSDGGMFDNLPFFPSLYLMEKVERAAWAKPPVGKHWYDLVLEKHAAPDLFIAGSLDISAPDNKEQFDYLLDIWNRAELLQNNDKINSFVGMSRTVDAQARKLHDAIQRQKGTPALLDDKWPSGSRGREVVMGMPQAAVLPVFPVDEKHLNGTFQFCASLGMQRERIALSIGDGCFQTLKSLAEKQLEAANHDANRKGIPLDLPILLRSVNALSQSAGKAYPLLPIIRWRSVDVRQKGKKKGADTDKQGQQKQADERNQEKKKDPAEHLGECPFFVHSADAVKSHEQLARRRLVENDKRELQAFVCPFHTDPNIVYPICRYDPVHQAQHRAGAPAS